MPRSSLAVRLAALATVVVLLLSGVVSYVAARSATATALAIAATEATKLGLERVLSVGRDAETGQRGFLLSGDAAYLAPYYAAVAALSDRLSQLQSSLSGDPVGAIQLAELRRLIKAKTDELAGTIDLYQAGDHAAALAMVRTGDGERIMEALRAQVAHMQATQASVLASELRTEARARVWTAGSIIAVWALALLLVATLILSARRENARVRVSEERLATTLRSIGDAVIATDARGHVSMLNAVAEQLTGWPSAEAIDAPLERVFRIVNEDTHAPVESPVERTLREGRIIGLANHTLLVGRDGAETPIEDSAAPIRDAAGEIVGVVLVFRDASTERSIEHALREADRRKDEFIAVLAHELRNPLAPILQASQLVQKPGATPQQLQWGHEVIGRQARTMGRLLDDLLDVSRITRGTLEVRKSRVSLAALVAGAVETARPTIDARRHTLVLDVPPEPIGLNADPVRITQVIANLLMNAAKYTDAGGTIRLTARCEARELILSVADNGVGLGPAALPRVFDMFVQVKKARDPHEGGLGIGLALAKRLVELHQGTIEARSDGEGLGSEFTVRLPCLVAAAAPGAGLAVSAGAGAVPGAPAGAVDGADASAAAPAAQRPLRIVIADDNRDAADSLAMLLQMEGHEVSVAHDGTAALSRVNAVHPDVAILDIGMPGLNGYQVAEKVRSGQSEPVILVALTGWGQAQDLERARRAGFDHHLVKPTEPGVVRALIARIGDSVRPGGRPVPPSV